MFLLGYVALVEEGQHRVVVSSITLDQVAVPLQDVHRLDTVSMAVELATLALHQLVHTPILAIEQQHDQPGGLHVNFRVHLLLHFAEQALTQLAPVLAGA